MTELRVPAGEHDQVAARRAVEALRSGVPSRAAVAALGSAQTEIEDRFAGLLEQAGDRPAGARHPAGLLLGGGFGSGKSHLLEHLAQLALDAGFVVGRVVVSKETPLYDPVKVFRAAAASAVVPGGHGPALVEAAASLDPGTPAHGDLWRWVSAQGAGLNERFAATLLLFDRLGATDGELADAIVRFWSGDPIKVAEVRRRLRETGEARYPLPAVPARELARQRFRFATRLMVAAGYSGWLVLFDEVELIGRYSVLQRGRSYAELARWVRGAHDDPGLPLVAVLAMTDDFEAAVRSAGTHLRWPAWSGWARPGCGSTCGPGSTSGTWSGSTRSSPRRPRWSTTPWTAPPPTARTPTWRGPLPTAAQKAAPSSRRAPGEWTRSWLGMTPARRDCRDQDAEAGYSGFFSTGRNWETAAGTRGGESGSRWQGAAGRGGECIDGGQCGAGVAER